MIINPKLCGSNFDQALKYLQKKNYNLLFSVYTKKIKEQLKGKKTIQNLSTEEN